MRKPRLARTTSTSSRNSSLSSLRCSPSLPMFLLETGSVAAGFGVLEETTAFKYDSTYRRNQRSAKVGIPLSCARFFAHRLHSTAVSDELHIPLALKLTVFTHQQTIMQVSRLKALLHIPHSVQSSPSFHEDKQFSQDVKVESPSRPARTRSTSCQRGSMRM